jgi:NTE family protein
MAKALEINKADAVFEGGGVKGIGLVGAIEAFEEAGIQWQNLAGTSAGSIVATLLAIGYDAAELRDVMDTRVDFRALRDASGIGRLPVVGPWLSLLFQKGMYAGDFFLHLMQDLIREKTGEKELKFGDLVLPKEPEDALEDYENKYKYKLRVIASDISNKTMLALPQDIRLLGLDPDRLEVARAVRMSISFPFFFKPVRIEEPQRTSRTHWIVDGGMLSNFPIWLFDSPAGQTPAWPTLGFLLAEPEPEGGPYRPIRGLLSMARAMIDTMAGFYDRKILEEYDVSRVVKIPTGAHSTLNFNLDAAARDWLYRSGKRAARDFLAEFDWDVYKRQQMQARQERSLKSRRPSGRER